MRWNFCLTVSERTGGRRSGFCADMWLFIALLGTPSLGYAAPDGACGAAHGQFFQATPSVNLCATGNTGAVVGDGPWVWKCAGIAGGSSKICHARTTALQVFKLNDSGQSLCYNSLHAAQPCDGIFEADAPMINFSSTDLCPRVDARFGRDAQTARGTLAKVGGGDAAFDYTKLCMNGTVCNAASVANTAANPAPTDWACTRDNVTGLVWSLQTFSNLTWDQALDPTRLASQNSLNRCGFSSGWTVPSLRQLLSLVHHGRYEPAIDADYFPGTVQNWHWSLDTNVLLGQERVWALHFGTGSTIGAYSTNTSYVLRLVRRTF
jgi:Protein of unknown function (DUF1566)